MMIRFFCARSCAAILVSGSVVAGCHAKPPTKSQQNPVIKDSVVVSFEDTGTVRGSPADARRFELRTPGQRDALRSLLRQERAQWRSMVPGAYQYLLKVDCFCPGRRGWLLMEVRENQPLRARDETGKSAAITDWNTFSVEGLFDVLEQAVTIDGVVQLAFDRRWHFPAYMRTIRQPGPDTWSVVEARALRPLPER